MRANGTLVVVGGGVCGLLHALAGRRGGWRVVQLERGSGPTGATPWAFGLIGVAGGVLGADPALLVRGRAAWRALASEVPGLGVRDDGVLAVATDDAGLARLEALEGADPEALVVGAIGVREANGALRGTIAGALHHPGDAVADPLRLLGGLRALLEADDGYAYVADSAVTFADGWHGEGSAHAEAADRVVLCTGRPPVADGVPELLVQGVVTAPWGERLATGVVHVADGVALVMVQRAGGELVVADATPRDATREEAPRGFLRAAAESLLGGPLPPVRRRWAAPLETPLAARAVVREELAPGIWRVGLGGLGGLTLAPLAAAETIGRL